MFCSNFVGSNGPCGATSLKFPGGVKTQITVDSGAEESVCPVGWGAEFGTEEPDRRLNLINASGAKIPHMGRRLVNVEAPF